MYLYIMRHAQADDHFQGEDFDKPLIEEGILAEKKLVSFLFKKGFLVDRIISSPLLRACQTAKIVKDRFKNTIVEVDVSLGDHFDTDSLIKVINEISSNGVAIVGHAPSLADLVNFLCKETPKVLALSKSSVVIIEFDDKVALGKGKYINYYSSKEIK